MRGSKKGLSTVISSVILLVGILIIGIFGVSWANSNLNLNEKILGDIYAKDINKIKESITPQHEWYKTGQKQLNVTFKNTGIDGLNVTEIVIKGTNSLDLKVPSTAVPLDGTFSKLINYDWTVDPSNSTVLPLDISLITNRGSIFTHQLEVPTDGQLIIRKIAKQADGNFTFYGDLGNFWIQTSGNTNNANLDVNGNLILSGTIRDFNGTSDPGGHPDFEKVCPCNFRVYQGLVLPDLGMDHEPVFNSQSNYEFNHGSAKFNQWFHDAPGVNIKKILNLTLIKQPTTPTTWTYSNLAFFPIDNQLFGNTPGQSHNFAFTYETHNTFTYEGHETFQFWGDDDVFVFINNKLALDLGGVHGGIGFPPDTRGLIRFDAQANQLGITTGGTYSFDFFYAERHTTSSEIKITTSIKLGNPGTGKSSVFFVDPGIYTIGENLPSGWTPQSPTCDNTYTKHNDTMITVTVPKGVTTCIFTNYHN